MNGPYTLCNICCFKKMDPYGHILAAMIICFMHKVWILQRMSIFSSIPQFLFSIEIRYTSARKFKVLIIKKMKKQGNFLITHNLGPSLIIF